MNDKIRLEGVYDDVIIELMSKKGINEYTFDFRPKSFNFIQKYRFEEMMTKFRLPSKRYYLHFCNEKEHIIKRIIEDLEGLQGKQDNIFLEFSDNQTAAWYDHFGLPIYWHYNSHENVNNISRPGTCGGSYSILIFWIATVPMNIWISLQ